MSEESSSCSTDEKLDYFNLLRNVNNILNLLSNRKNSTINSDVEQDIDELNDISHKIDRNLDSIVREMNHSRQSMFVVTLLNTFIRICALAYTKKIRLSRRFFKTENVLLERCETMVEESDKYKECYSDMLESMLINLGKDNLIEICFTHLLQTEPQSITDSTTTNVESVDDTSDDFIGILAECIECCSALARKSVIRSAFEFEKNHCDVMNSLLKFVNSYMKAEDKEVHGNNERLIEVVLGFLVNLTDKISLIPMFINIGCHTAVIEWLEVDTFKSIDSDLASNIITIVYNLARAKSGLEALRKQKAFGALMKRQELIIDHNDDDLEYMFAAAVVLIASNSEKQKANKALIIKAGNYWCQAAENASSSQSLQSDSGFHLSEHLMLLHHAVSNSTIAECILKENSKVNEERVLFFVNLFPKIYGALFDSEADELEQSAVDSLLKIILHMCCYEEYRTVVQSEDASCAIVECLAKRLKQNVAKCISGVLQLEKSRSEKETKQPRLIYISFHWDNKEFCKEFSFWLKCELNEFFWVDNENFDVWEEMSEYESSAIHVANVIIVLMSNSYHGDIDRFPVLKHAIFKSSEAKDFTNVDTAQDAGNGEDLVATSLRPIQVSTAMVPYGPSVADKNLSRASTTEASGLKNEDKLIILIIVERNFDRKLIKETVEKHNILSYDSEYHAADKVCHLIRTHEESLKKKKSKQSYGRRRSKRKDSTATTQIRQNDESNSIESERL